MCQCGGGRLALEGVVTCHHPAPGGTKYRAEVPRGAEAREALISLPPLLSTKQEVSK